FGGLQGRPDNHVRIEAPTRVHVETRTVERQIVEIIVVEVCRNGICYEEFRKVVHTVLEQISVIVQDTGRIDNLSINGDVDFAEIITGFEGRVGTVLVIGHMRSTQHDPV